MKTTDRLGVPGELVLAQKGSLVSQGNPKLPDVAQSVPMHWINSKPQGPLAVRRLLPWVYPGHRRLRCAGISRFRRVPRAL